MKQLTKNFLLAILVSGVNLSFGQSNKLTAIVDEIAKVNQVQDERVGPEGNESETYKNFKQLKEIATKEELVQLTDTIKTKYLPQFFPSFWIKEYGIVGLPFVEDISIGFVEKENGAYSYLLKDIFPALNISLADLLKISIQNLEKEFEDCEIKQFQLEGGGLVFWNSDDDNFLL